MFEGGWVQRRSTCKRWTSFGPTVKKTYIGGQNCGGGGPALDPMLNSYSGAYIVGQRGGGGVQTPGPPPLDAHLYLCNI